MDVEEAVVLEELMGGECQVVFNSGHGRVDLGPGSQMGNISQSFKRNVLAVEGILVVIAFTVDLSLLERLALQLQLDGLSLPDGFFNFASKSEGVGSLGLLELLPVGDGVVNDHLQRDVVGPVNELDEEQRIFCLKSCFSGPSDHSDHLVHIGLPVAQQVRQSHVLSNQVFWLVFLEELFRELIGVEAV
jgi:hypothetical protein